ncbi:uncharacterized protein LOC127170432 [Labeo rohita]|uniref:uncharacterized protein LOC127170432 n=1 Tax=Labeo rohita TaxID=84645 RepID=UPI0021E239AC|nr:uncharacterized protein LOC127170432 [Labeo rohita]
MYSASTWLTFQVAVMRLAAFDTRQTRKCAATVMSSEQESERLCPHPKKVSSPVWEFFGFKENNSLDSPICRKCHATVSAKGGNTTNLFTHLRVHHPLDYAILQKGAFKKREQARASGQLTIFESVERKRKADMTSACEDTAITKSLAYFIAKDMMPIKTHCSGGKRMSRSFQGWQKWHKRSFAFPPPVLHQKDFSALQETFRQCFAPV